MEKRSNFRARVMKYAWQLWKTTGTLRNVPAGATLGGKRVTKPSYRTMAYFDTEKNGFRCFKVENLICEI